MLVVSGMALHYLLYLYFYICVFDTWKPFFSKICHMLGLHGTSLYAVFVYMLGLSVYMLSFKKIYGLYGLEHHIKGKWIQIFGAHRQTDRHKAAEAQKPL